MLIDIVTLFPDMFRGPFDESIIRRARDNKFAEIVIHIKSTLFIPSTSSGQACYPAA